MNTNQELIRIGVFYDGNYFFKTLDNFKGRTWPSDVKIENERMDMVKGLPKFIVYKVAQELKHEKHLCRIVEAHYFDGLKYPDMDIFHDKLGEAGLTIHTMEGMDKKEKSIDAPLTKKVLKLAKDKKFDILVLIAYDEKFVPLVRELTSMKMKVMLLYWEFDGIFRWRDRTCFVYVPPAPKLIEEAIYPVDMNKLSEHAS